MGTIGIRRENKGRYERRAALGPTHVSRAVAEHGLRFVVEPSDVRFYSDATYEAAGAKLGHGSADADVILGVKEIPVRHLERGKAYVFFSHTIKGQGHNMPMLRRIMDLRCTLIDYERIIDAQGRRLVFFGYQAGLAGMIDTLWMTGRKLAERGWAGNPLLGVKQAFDFEDLDDACRTIRAAGEIIALKGLPGDLAPFVIGFAGYGNVSRGAQFVSDHLPTTEILPEELPALFAPGAQVNRHTFYKVIFKEQHLATRIDGAGFELQDYYDYPERYRGLFENHLPHLSTLVNCVYWEPRYPRLVTLSALDALHEEGRLRLISIGDVTCDIDGSIETTIEATDQDRPILMYDPGHGKVVRSNEGPGVATMAVDNLPCELPKDAINHFGVSLYSFLPDLAGLDREATFDRLQLKDELKRAVIVWNGELTPAYRYLEQYVRDVIPKEESP